jgi:hypothetical protein
MGPAKRNAIAGFRLRLNRRMAQKRGEDSLRILRQRGLRMIGEGRGAREIRARVMSRFDHRAMMRASAAATRGQTRIGVREHRRNNQREADQPEQRNRAHVTHGFNRTAGERLVARKSGMLHFRAHAARGPRSSGKEHRGDHQEENEGNQG